METITDPLQTPNSSPKSEPTSQVKCACGYVPDAEFLHWMRKADLSGFVCPECAQKLEEADAHAEFLAGIEDWASRKLSESGLYPREIRARWELIPGPIKAVLPEPELGVMKRGFGLSSSTTGGGKTLAMAALFRELLKAYGRKHWSFKRHMQPWLLWNSWPETVAWIRSNATSDSLPDLISSLQTTQVVFLDDLGSERIRGSYIEDFAASQLDQIIDIRWRRELPTFYTTNLDMAGLIGIYGARLVSRLCGENPLHVVGGLKDLRIGARR